MSTTTSLTKKDFVSSQDVRWCPGCGDYAVLSAVQKTLPLLGIPKSKIVFISGIGCSSRFPYYMDTYGFHTIHGRAPAFATGLALARPDLSIWVITGDGDGLSIGGNHLIHAVRRNVNLNILLFNNQTYGLTKGQYSPTSHAGTLSKSTPFGSVDHPFSPLSVVCGANAGFMARTYDKDQKHMTSIFQRAFEYQGTSFVEIYQNCVIFNDNVFENSVGKDVRTQNLLFLEDEKPLHFGENEAEGITIGKDMSPVRIKNAPESKEKAMVHSEKRELSYSLILSRLSQPHFPEVMGVLRSSPRPSLGASIKEQNDQITQKLGTGDLSTLLHSGDVWKIDSLN